MPCRIGIGAEREADVAVGPDEAVDDVVDAIRVGRFPSGESAQGRFAAGVGRQIQDALQYREDEVVPVGGRWILGSGLHGIGGPPAEARDVQRIRVDGLQMGEMVGTAEGEPFPEERDHRFPAAFPQLGWNGSVEQRAGYVRRDGAGEIEQALGDLFIVVGFEDLGAALEGLGHEFDRGGRRTGPSVRVVLPEPRRIRHPPGEDELDPFLESGFGQHSVHAPSFTNDGPSGKARVGSGNNAGPGAFDV